MLVQEDLKSVQHCLRELLAAGEPLNPEVIEKVHAAWGLTIRDFYGQTETTAQIGNAPGQPIKPGSMGRPLPGYRIRVVDTEDGDAEEGLIAIALDPGPAA
jgi:acetyl-CoA synthetase